LVSDTSEAPLLKLLEAQWREIDRYPDTPKRAAAWETFQYLDQITPEWIGACGDVFQKHPCVKFEPDAQERFSAWRLDLERLLRSKTLHPSLESHLSKYRKLVPTLALINHLAARRTENVTADAVERAISFAAYLETHARRAYASGIAAEADIARAILARVRKGNLTDGFTAREITQRGWSNLSNREQVQAGLDLLADHGWLADIEHRERHGGRPKVTYRINPAARAAA
jgi:hypothetical protein